MSENRPDGLVKFSLAFLFFVSGATALAYEVVWIRMFAVASGGTSRAVSSVIAAYMGGLALGAFAGGRLADRRSWRPVKVYGILEGAIGLSALLLTLAIPALLPALRLGRQLLGPGLGFDLFRFFAGWLFLLIPTTLMGATFPVLLKGLLRDRERFGGAAGLLYAANTLGAVAGSLAVSFVAIPWRGHFRAVLLAAALNLAIMAVALTTRLKTMEAAAAPMKKTPGRPAVPLAMVLAVTVGYAVSGLVSMIYQVGWIRALSLSLGNSTYALGLILAAFIGGLALGGVLITPLIDRARNTLLAAGVLEVLIGVSALAVVPLFEWITVRMFGWNASLIDRFHATQALRFAAAFGLILAPAMAMGALFPVAVKLGAKLWPGVAEPAGRIYAANSLGALLGAFLATHLFIRTMGVQSSLLAATVISAAVGALWIAMAGPLKKTAAPALLALAAAIAAAAVIPRWDPLIMSSGPFLYAREMEAEEIKKTGVRDSLHNNIRVLFHKEGVEATVSVFEHRASGDRFLRINGKTDASTRGDLFTQVLSAEIPLLLHPRPEKVMVVGLASGITAGSALLRPAVKNLDCLEISPEVAAAADYFDSVNNLDFLDPRFRLVIDDARNWLELNPDLYDLIIVEPTNPWVSGMSALFTHEFFALLERHLRPGGMAVLWLPFYDMDPDSVKLAVRTFMETFPQTTLWESTPFTDYLLLGSQTPLSVSIDDLRRRASAPAVAQDLARLKVKRPEDILARFVMGPERLKLIAGPGPLHTDDRRQLEFAIPKIMVQPPEKRLTALWAEILSGHHSAAAMVTDTGQKTRDRLERFDALKGQFYRAALTQISPEGDHELVISMWSNLLLIADDAYPAGFAARDLAALLVMRAEALLEQNAAAAAEDLAEAYELDRNAKAAVMLTEMYKSRGDMENAVKWAARTLLAMPREPYALTVLAVDAQARADMRAAEDYYRQAVISAPRSYDYRYNYALFLARAQRPREAEAQLATLLERFPESVEAMAVMAGVLRDQGKQTQALSWARKGLAIDPNYQPLQGFVGRDHEKK